MVHMSNFALERWAFRLCGHKELSPFLSLSAVFQGIPTLAVSLSGIITAAYEDRPMHILVLTTMLMFVCDYKKNFRNTLSKLQPNLHIYMSQTKLLATKFKHV